MGKIEKNNKHDIPFNKFNKKIDLLNNNIKINNNKNIQNMSKQKKSNSKSQKYDKTDCDSESDEYSNEKLITKPKRRGRRPKKIFDEEDSTVDVDEDNDEDNVDEAHTLNDESKTANNSAVILRLKLDPSKINNLRKNQTEPILSKRKSVSNLSDHETDGMFGNDIPIDSVCHKCAKYEKTISILKQKLEKYEKKDQVNKHNKIHYNNITFIECKTGNKLSLKKTTNKCLWDGHPITNIPFPLPELYHNGYYICKYFCSINCALSYNLYILKDSKIYQRKSLAIKLYRELYALPSDFELTIKEAPPREILEDYGGDVTIEQFRKSFNVLDKEYITYIPPLKPLGTLIEEQTNGSNDNISDKQYTLKRNKPLSKKRSIVSSMNLNIDEDDD